MTRYKTMGISSFLSVPDKAAKRFRPAIRRSAWTRLALVGALFTASHARANETRQVVSSNGTTNTVERIDFPVGDIKDIIPAGDKYIIHANPIDSLKGGVAVDALFVMEKDQNDRAFGRTFSKGIHSAAYVPGLDIAVWSYESDQEGDLDANNNLLQLRSGDTSLTAAMSVSNFVAESEIFPNTELFGSQNFVYQMSNQGVQKHEFSFINGQYEESIGGSSSLGTALKRYTSDEYGVIVARSDKANQLSHYRFNATTKQYRNLSDFIFPLSMAKASISEDEGNVVLGYEDGRLESRKYDTLGMNIENQMYMWPNHPITSMDGVSSNEVVAVSSTTNEVAKIRQDLLASERMTPNAQETGYRKVITDGNDTLLLSNTHSNYFYRVRKTR